MVQLINDRKNVIRNKNHERLYKGIFRATTTIIIIIHIQIEMYIVTLCHKELKIGKKY